MAENNAIDPVPIEVVQEQHEAIITAATAAIDWDHSDDDNVDDDDDDDEDYSSETSSIYAEEHREVFEQRWLSKIVALSTELNVVFENIRIRLNGCNSRIFSLTLRNPPVGACWEDGTQAILRVRNRLNDGDDTFEANLSAEASRSETGDDSHIPESPVSATTDASASSGLSGSTLVDEHQDANQEDGLGEDGPDVSNSDDSSESSDSSGGSEYTDASEDTGANVENFQWERLDKTLVLNLVEDNGIPAPRVLAYDVSSQNALGFAYSIRTRVPGEPMSDYHRRREFTSKDRLWLANEIAEVRVRLETIQFEEAGRLLANEDEDHSSAEKLPLSLSSRADISEKLSIWGFRQGTGWMHGRNRSGKSQPCFQTLYGLMVYTAQNLINFELKRKHRGRESRIRRYLFIKDMIQDMDRLGWFPSDEKASEKIVLNYWHQSGHNTLVERTGDSENPWRLSGFIGWDESEAVPAILARTPPAWLWHGFNDDKLPRDLRDYYQGDVELLPVEMSYLTAKDLAVKQRYEDIMIEKLYTPVYGKDARAKYLDDAYGRGRWLRRVFRFAREGISCVDGFLRFNALVQEWSEYMKDKNIQYKGLYLWDGAYVKSKDDGPRMYVPGIQYDPEATTDTEPEELEAGKTGVSETEQPTIES